VPSVRFSRDKRGYEYVYLVHTPIRRGKPGRTRVLYWYRTPPGVRIGRRPFDEEVRQTLERQNPGIEFAWDTIINTPMPPPDMTEYWRERRRAEKVARQERRAVEAEDAASGEAENSTTTESPEAGRALESAPESNSVEAGSAVDPTMSASDAAIAPATEAPAQNGDEGQGPRKRRRRRGGRRRRPGVETAGQETADGNVPESVESQESDSEGQSEDDDSTSEEQ